MDHLPDIKLAYWPNNFQNEVLNYGRKIFINNKLRLYKIPFVRYDEIEYYSTLNEMDNGDINSLLKIIDNRVEYLHPFDIPVIFEDCDNMEYGCFRPIYIGEDSKQIKKLVFAEYIITNKLTGLTPGIYAHEIVHSQLENMNAIENYSNYEVLTVFFDKLTSFELDPTGNVLRNNELLRLKKLREALILLQNKNIDSFNKINLSMAVISLLKAENLFSMYFDGSVLDKKSLMYDIGKVFRGITSLDKMLEQNNITLDNSQNSKIIMKRLNMFDK